MHVAQCHLKQGSQQRHADILDWIIYCVWLSCALWNHPWPLPLEVSRTHPSGCDNIASLHAVTSIVSHTLYLWTTPARPLCPWDSPGKNTGVGCHFLLQGIFPTQGLNPRLLCLLLWQESSLPLAQMVSQTRGLAKVKSENITCSVVSDSL